MRSIVTIKPLIEQSIESFALSWYCGIIGRVYLKQMERHCSCAWYDVQSRGAPDRHKGCLLKIYFEVINAMTNRNVPRKRHSLDIEETYWCHFIRRTFFVMPIVCLSTCACICVIFCQYMGEYRIAQKSTFRAFGVSLDLINNKW